MARRPEWGLAWRGLRWRLPLSAAVFVAAVVTAGSAALGPLYARAAAESTLRDGLTQAAVEDSGLRLEASYRSDGVAEEQVSLARLRRSFAAAPPAGSLLGYPHAIATSERDVGASAPGGFKTVTGLVWRDGACRQVRLTAGRCPAAAGEAMVSARTVADPAVRWRLGGGLTTSDGTALRIVGVYRPIDTNARFWFGRNYFDPGPDPSGAQRVDSVFVAQSTLAHLPAGTDLRGEVDYPLDPADVRLADVPRLRAESAAVQRRFAGGSTFVTTTRLSHVLDDAAHQRALVDIGADVVTAQLTLLGWLVLFLVLVDVADARGGEIALAKLRGLSVTAIWRFGLTEPLLVLLAAMPVGFALGLAGALLFAGLVLAPGIPVLVPWTSPAAVAVAFAGGLVAAVVAARRVIVRPVVDQWRRTPGRAALPRAVLAMEALVSLAAVAGLIALRVLPDGAPGALLLAPGLLVLAVALLGTRLIPLTTRSLIPLTRASRRIGLFLGSRQVARRPAGLRLASLLAVAVGLASFGVAGESVSAANRAARAAAEVGAPTVLSIQYDEQVDPAAAVRRADPGGTWATAAATWLPDGGVTVVGTVLAVDASRLAAVGSAARGGPSTGTLARLLRAGTVPGLTVRGTAIRAGITATGTRAGAAPGVRFDLLTAGGKPVEADAGVIRNGAHTYTAAIPCAAGCAFVGLTWDRIPAGPVPTMTGTLRLTDLAAGAGTALSPVGARLTDAGAWRAEAPEGEATDSVRAGTAGVQDRFEATDGGFGGIAYASTAYPIPLVATPSAIVANTEGGGRAVQDGSGTSAAVRVARVTPVLPVVLDGGVLADLGAMQAQLPSFDDEAQWHVWLAADAPPDAVQRLRAAGLVVQSATTTADRQALLARQAPALSLLLLLVSAFVGALLAMGATAVSIAATARRRSYESAALQAVRVPRPALFRAAAIEQGFLLGGACLLGVPAGLVAAIITLPVLPEFATPTPVVLRYLPPPGPAIAFALLFTALVIATALAAAVVVQRQARPSRLREGEE